MSGPLKITMPLIVPIEHDGETLHELELTEPNFKAMRVLDRGKGDVDKNILMIAACTRLPVSVVEQLYARDIGRLGDEAAKLMGEVYPEIGEKPPPGSRTGSNGSQVSSTD